MTDNHVIKKPILGRRILVPGWDVTEERPKVVLKQIKENKPADSNQTSSDSNSIASKSTNLDTMSNNTEFSKSIDTLRQRLMEAQGLTQSKPIITTPIIQAPIVREPTATATAKEESTLAPMTNGTRFFKFPRNSMPVGRSCHALKWNGPQFNVLEASGSTADYVRYLGWHLHGAAVWIGTSATGAADKVSVDPAAGVTGLIPQATKQIADMVRTSMNLSSDAKGLDPDGRPYQFAIIAVIGGQDHAAVERQMNNTNMNRDFAEVFRAIGIPPSTSFKAAIYNDMGKLFALEVSFGHGAELGSGTHLIFLHPANDIGGGKSDESLRDRRLRAQCRSLSSEFDWWIAGLERGGGRIGAIETTLGGTARIGRYALLAARLPRTLIAADACEIINVDRADWVKEHIPSQIQEYRANFATTLLRTAWGKAGERLHGIPITIVDRFDRSLMKTRRFKATIAVLRHLFLGHPQIELLQGDISDERIAQRREENITASDYMTIFDTVKNKPKGPWPQQRRLRMSTSISISSAKILSLAKGDDPIQAIDDAEQIIEKLRGLATSQDGALPAGGFIVIDAIIPSKLLEDSNSNVTNNTVARAAETIAQGLSAKGIEKPLVNLYQLPKGLGEDLDQVVVHITEDQVGTNVLIVSTEEVETHSKRTIMQNPNLKSIQDTTISTVFAFGRLLGSMVSAHKESGYIPCEQDGDLVHAFHRHFYGGRYGNRPNLLPGGSDRVRNKTDN